MFRIILWQHRRLFLRGQGLVEFALIIPLLMLILMGIFDLGRAIYANTVISNGAREGARVAIIATKTNRNILDAVETHAIGIGITDAMISINPSSTRTSGQPVTITVNYPFLAITPLIGNFLGAGGQLMLSSASTMLVEY